VETIKDHWNWVINRAHQRSVDEIKSKAEEIDQFRIRLANQVGELEQSQRNFNDFVVSSTNEISELKSKLSKNASEFELAVNLYLEKEKRMDEILGKSSKIGLAGAFGNRAAKLAIGKYLWVLLLAASLIAIYCNGSSVLSGLQTKIEWPQLAVRALLSFPLIWAAWFAAKQFAYSSRLQEDYEFKVASAMSYEGYKKEAAELGDAMQLKLIESAIGTYSENPLRIYNIPSDAGTPLQELLGSFSKIEKIAEIAAKLPKPVA